MQGVISADISSMSGSTDVKNRMIKEADQKSR